MKYKKIIYGILGFVAVVFLGVLIWAQKSVENVKTPEIEWEMTEVVKEEPKSEEKVVLEDTEEMTEKETEQDSSKKDVQSTVKKETEKVPVKEQESSKKTETYGKTENSDKTETPNKTENSDKQETSEKPAVEPEQPGLPGQPSIEPEQPELPEQPSIEPEQPEDKPTIGHVDEDGNIIIDFDTIFD